MVESGDVAWAGELLAKFCANVDWPSQDDLRVRMTLSGSMTDLDRSWDTSTVLAIASEEEDLPMVRLLLAHGADVNKVKSNGERVESEAEMRIRDAKEAEEAEARRQRQGGRGKGGKGLGKGGARRFKMQDHEKETPLSIALGTGNAAIIELLKSKGALEALPNEAGSDGPMRVGCY